MPKRQRIFQNLFVFIHLLLPRIASLVAYNSVNNEGPTSVVLIVFKIFLRATDFSIIKQRDLQQFPVNEEPTGRFDEFFGRICF